MLIPTSELGRFDSMVMPFELEAYDILKSRSGKQRNALNITFLIILIDTTQHEKLETAQKNYT